jgi:hypothetical protein
MSMPRLGLLLVALGFAVAVAPARSWSEPLFAAAISFDTGARPNAVAMGAVQRPASRWKRICGGIGSYRALALRRR